MIVGIKVSGFDEKDEKLSLKEEKRGLLCVSRLIYKRWWMMRGKMC